MTRQEFESVVRELERIRGQLFSQKWQDERFELVKNIDATQFREACVANLSNGGDFIILDEVSHHPVKVN